ncbi:hypothetical protein [Lentimicrobium sp. S6]|uniref:hypothetical protein n=1 Tax=Lentimicrobium sp. S6 TaxID=2735872 RepID=UPI00155291F4|nr:hypothetical protein [Lentimicrobium sp. S6]NPD45113.1 hypothetical protein [Lentimicrobium sp. S6]
MSPFNERIISFTKGSSRNKIIIATDEIPGISVLDIGYQLSEKLKTITGKSNLSLRASRFSEILFEKHITQDEALGSILYIKNIGILFEPKLKIDTQALIERYSKNNTLIIQWDYEFKDHKLFFKNTSNHYLDLSYLSYLIAE